MAAKIIINGTEASLVESVWQCADLELLADLNFLDDKWTADNAETYHPDMDQAVVAYVLEITGGSLISMDPEPVTTLPSARF